MAHESLGSNGNHISKSNSERVTYPDGTTNIVWKNMGDTVDFTRHQSLSPTPGNVIGLNINYDQGESEQNMVSTLVLFGGEDDMVRYDFIPKGGVRTTHLPEGGLDVWRDLTDHSVTIDSRPGLLGGGKLQAVASLTSTTGMDSVSPAKEGKLNPLMQAQDERRF